MIRNKAKILIAAALVLFVVAYFVYGGLVAFGPRM